MKSQYEFSLERIKLLYSDSRVWKKIEKMVHEFARFFNLFMRCNTFDSTKVESVSGKFLV